MISTWSNKPGRLSGGPAAPKEVVMSGRRGHNFPISARTVALGAGIASLVALIVLTSPAPEAAAAPAPKITAGFQTTDHVVLHVHLRGKGTLAVALGRQEGNDPGPPPPAV